MNPSTPQGIAVLDFGGQYAHLIANRIRRLHVYSEILPPDADTPVLRRFQGLILSGGPASVYDPDQPSFNPEMFRIGLPLLGLCYGHQLLAQQLGGQVQPGTTKEYGTAQLEIARDIGVLRGLEEREIVWMSHGDQVIHLPPGFQILARTEDCPTAAIGDPDRKLYGLQFHPEVTHTSHGMKILENFIVECGCERSWTMTDFIGQKIGELRAQVGDRNVFLLVSGGVDSTVAFALLNQALGTERVYGLHIDNGFMRKNETRFVVRALSECGFGNLHVVDATDLFLSVVKGITDPEEKRRIIGATFIQIKDQAVGHLQLDPEQWMLGQGTIYPDTIESGGTRNAAVIKTHHNRVDVIQQLLAQGKVVEPLSQLYKDEVRQVGEQLGLPHALVARHPFPGPGLAIRVLCSDGTVEVQDAREIQDQAQAMARPFGLKAVLLPIRSVGVQGDFRTYAHPVALIGEANWSTLERISTTITNTIPAVNRVVYLLRPGDLPAQSLKRSYLTKERLDLLREADHLAMSALEQHGLMEQIWQMPTVLLPLSSDGYKETIVLRPVYSQEAMTARFAEIPMCVAQGMADDILRIGGLDVVLYDVTHKPPGTIEWE